MYEGADQERPIDESVEPRVPSVFDAAESAIDPVMPDVGPDLDDIDEEAPGSAGGSGAMTWLLETVLTIAAAVALALFLQAYVVKTYVVPTGSMVPTIQLEDRIISNRLAFRIGVPEPGDVVVFENPSHEGPPLVKRVIAVEGQELDMQEGVIILDGVEQEEPYIQDARRGKDSWDSPVTIPEGEIWLMGDNRVGSSDSRVFGTVPIEDVYGQAFFTYWPPVSFGVLD